MASKPVKAVDVKPGTVLSFSYPGEKPFPVVVTGVSPFGEKLKLEGHRDCDRRSVIVTLVPTSDILYETQVTPVWERSWGAWMSLQEIEASLGADHVAWIRERPFPAGTARSRAAGAWDANEKVSHNAYRSLAELFDEKAGDGA